MATNSDPPPYSPRSSGLRPRERISTGSYLPSDGEPRILLGIDYGTTFTGLAWCLDDGLNEPSIDDITVYKGWPGGNTTKVPSTYSYDKVEQGRPPRKQWGHDIDRLSHVIRWTKLSLGKQSSEQELLALRDLLRSFSPQNNQMSTTPAGLNAHVPGHVAKSPTDVVSDYLEKVIKQWHNSVTATSRHTFEHVPLDVVITHPAKWPYENLNSLYRAVNNSLLRQNVRLRDIFLSSEPESCALYTTHGMTAYSEDSLIVGESFIVCDAGGGTIDLVSYRILSNAPLELQKVGVITGGNFGATLIDKAFLDWLRPRILNLNLSSNADSRNGLHVMGPIGGNLVENFQRVKHSFTGDPTQGPFVVTVPSDALVSTRYRDDYDSDLLEISFADLQMMFDSAVQGVVKLIEEQYDILVGYTAPEEQSNVVTNVFMAGGFSESTYLKNQVKAWAGRMPTLRIRQAEDCWSSVVKGAILRGLDLGMMSGPPVIACPYHLGICAAQEYRRHIHGPQSTARDTYRGLSLVQDHINWMVHQGDVITPYTGIEKRMKLRVSFSQYERDSPRGMYVTCLITTRRKAPPSLDDMNESEIVKILVHCNDLTESKTEQKVAVPTTIATKAPDERPNLYTKLRKRSKLTPTDQPRQACMFQVADLDVVLRVVDRTVLIQVEENGSVIGIPYRQAF
ncbi:hypothetical protein MMC25_006630 [Agyrium rufum]|nr:hypothetical protein [Agyrium rufum]